ncbi:MAG TPA: hypothetical protein VH740_08515 [Vicinamibacterales bacterium]|jgi:hypothetical protein
MRAPARSALTTAIACVSFALATTAANGPRFFRDDPIQRDPETVDASSVEPSELSGLYDFAENSFFGAGDKTDKRAVNVNTIDEVPDSSWFTNRLGREPWTADRLAKGPDTGSGPSGAWTIVSGKMEGRAPGFTIRDAARQLYFVKFDPPSNPEMASGAEVISTKLFHAFGYHVPENYIASVQRESLVIGDGAQIEDNSGRKRQMDSRDLDMLLERAAKHADGTYRALASKALDGKPVGPFRYHGTRPDDPNDIFPHEHRRELRGLRAFCAWLNHDDSRSINSLDTLVSANGKTIVRHHLLDFGSTLGSGTVQAQSTRAGNEFLWESRPTFVTMLTLGLYVRPWIKVDYPHITSLGRIESAYFNPENWKPEYPNAAFANARGDDLFWAARILSAVTDDGVRAVVATAKYSDSNAAEYLVKTLLERKRKVLAAWLNKTNPVVNAALSGGGELTFENAPEKAGVGPAAERYTIQWSQFDNAASTHKNVGAEQTVTTTKASAPAELLSARPEYVAAMIRAHHRDRPDWAQPLLLYFRKAGDGWSLVGVERHAQ